LKSKLSRLLVTGIEPLWRHWFKPNGEGSLDAPLDHPPFPVDQFQLDQMAQELNVVLALGRALPGELVVFQQDLWRIGHAASSDSRHMRTPVRKSSTVAAG
jgi:hypothetical protein